MQQISFSLAEQQQLKAFAIEAVILFGSQAQGIAQESSDYDIGVITFSQKRKEIYSFLYDLLSEKINKLTDIDIVFLDSAPGELLAHVAKYGLVLYQESPQVFANFKEKVMNQYADFAPLRTIFSNATLSRISP